MVNCLEMSISSPVIAAGASAIWLFHIDHCACVIDCRVLDRYDGERAVSSQSDRTALPHH